jgi:CHASE2 domain-containing sensor protein
LVADAATSGAAGLLMALDAEFLADLLRVPASLLFYAGLILLPWAALVAWLATRETLPRAGVWAVIGGNALWAADSVLLLLTGWIEPNGMGLAVVIVQAVAVIVFAERQYSGLRKLDSESSRPAFRSNVSRIAT